MLAAVILGLKAALEHWDDLTDCGEPDSTYIAVEGLLEILESEGSSFIKFVLERYEEASWAEEASQHSTSAHWMGQLLERSTTEGWKERVYGFIDGVQEFGRRVSKLKGPFDDQSMHRGSL